MEYDKVKQLIEDMGNSKLTALDIEFPDGTKISMKKEQRDLLNAKTSEITSTNDVKNVEIKVTEIQNEEENVDGNIVKSPMVGTFYAKSSPNSAPYVTIGQNVKKGDILCIVEAMKLMNEIESEFDGKIKEILVKDGEPVEYGMPLFIIK